MTPPDITVIVPVFNGRDLVRGGLDSVLDHTRARLEVLCVDDASTDGSAELLDTIAASDPRVRVFRLASNRGAGAARNQGLVEASGRWIAFLDADDTMTPGALDRLLAAGEGNGCDLVVGRVAWLRTPQQEESEARREPATPATITLARDSPLLQSVPGHHCANLYSRVLLERESLRYEADLTFGEDQLFQATAMVRANRVAILDAVVYVYRQYHADSLTRRSPRLRNLVDDIEFHRRVARLFLANGLDDAAAKFVRFWSYSIREYWGRMPGLFSVEEGRVVFEAFRSLIREFQVTDWAPATPPSHRRLLDLIVSGDDSAAWALLAGGLARMESAHP